MEKNQFADDSTRWSVFIGLASLFIASIVTAQVLGSKLVPINWPINNIYAPAGVIAYAITFFATDCVAELYGKQKAKSLVRWGFGINFVFLALIWVAIWMPAGEVGIPQEMFAGTLAPATDIIIASLTAYLLAQHWDVYVFHWVRERTGSDRLYLRNLLSTGTSQLVDTIVFSLTAWVLLPTLTGIGHALPPAIVGGTIVGQYALKLIIAAVDTPLVYLAVYGADNYTDINRADAHGAQS